MSERVFLTAEWRQLVMLNYQIEPSQLANLVPSGTELDSHEGRAFVSVVGFRFLRTKVLGWRIPFHQDFDEVNLRFYVKRADSTGMKRGVVFVREIVPRFAIAAIARRVFHEKYVSRPMSHRLDVDGAKKSVEYGWREGSRNNILGVECGGPAAIPADGSIEQFITEHYWGYASRSDGGCMEYRVEHPPWRIWAAGTSTFDGDTAALCGAGISALLKRPADSAFLAEGSAVTVYSGHPIV